VGGGVNVGEKRRDENPAGVRGENSKTGKGDACRLADGIGVETQFSPLSLVR
jgi:hypothetical protein